MFSPIELAAAATILIAAIGTNLLGRQHRVRKVWGPLDFREPPVSKDLISVDADAARRVIKAHACKLIEINAPGQKSMISRGHYDWDDSKPDEVKIRVQAETGRWSQGRNGLEWHRESGWLMFLRWALVPTATGSLEVRTQWAVRDTKANEARCEMIFDRIVSQVFMELGSLSQANQLFFPSAALQAIAATASVRDEQQSEVRKLRKTQWHQSDHVELPERIYNDGKLERIVPVVELIASQGGELIDPVMGIMELHWTGEIIEDESEQSEDGAIISVTINYSDYSNPNHDTGTFVLSHELVMRFSLIQEKGGVGLKCKWKGEFNAASGDMVRHIIALIDDAALVSSGRSPVMVPRRAKPSRVGISKPKLAPNTNDGRIAWPTLQDVNEAIQCPSVCFLDPELKKGAPELTAFGFPRVATGAFASVYKMQCGGVSYAVRFFNSPVRDQEDRYHKTSKFICSDDLPYTVPLEYLEEAINIGGRKYPVLKMEWVEGVPLNSYIEQNLDNPRQLAALRQKFYKMMCDLRDAGIAHSDLQHGNVLIRDDEIVLVDYDGMFVPELSGFLSNELGHPNYQHPSRGARHFGPNIDNFSAWLIDSCLLCLCIDATLWRRFSGDGESLLFKRADLENCTSSHLFNTLSAHSSEYIRSRAAYLQTLLGAGFDQIPFLAPEHAPLLNKSKV